MIKSVLFRFKSGAHGICAGSGKAGSYRNLIGCAMAVAFVIKAIFHIATDAVIYMLATAVILIAVRIHLYFHSSLPGVCFPAQYQFTRYSLFHTQKHFGKKRNYGVVRNCGFAPLR